MIGAKQMNMMTGGYMLQYNILIYAVLIVLTLLVFLLTGYLMGRKTVTDTPLFEKKFNPKDNKEPEPDEIMRCLQEKG